MVISAPEADKLKAYFASHAKELLDKGLTIQKINGKDVLFSVSPADGSYKINFGEEEFINYLKDFLRTIDEETLKKSLQKDGTNDYYVLIDGWGNKIYYAYPGRFNKTGYDLYSAGSDNRLGKDADSVSAENLNKAKQETFKDTATNEMLCDDICNF